MASKTFADIWDANGINITDVWIHTASLSNGLNVQINGLMLPVAHDSAIDRGIPVGIPAGSGPSTDFPFFYTNDNFIKVFEHVVRIFQLEDPSEVAGVLISATHDFVAIAREHVGPNGNYSWQTYKVCRFYDTIQTFMFRLRGFQPNPSNSMGLNLMVMDYIDNPGTWEWQGTTVSEAEDAVAAQELYRVHFGIQVQQPWNDPSVYMVQ